MGRVFGAKDEPRLPPFVWTIPAFDGEHGVCLSVFSAQEQAMLQNIPLEDNTAQSTDPDAAVKAGSAAATKKDDSKVDLEAHVMSKCPDAQDCLQQLIIPAMSEVSELGDYAWAKRLSWK